MVAPRPSVRQSPGEFRANPDDPQSLITFLRSSAAPTQEELKEAQDLETILRGFAERQERGTEPHPDPLAVEAETLALALRSFPDPLAPPPEAEAGLFERKARPLFSAAEGFAEGFAEGRGGPVSSPPKVHPMLQGFVNLGHQIGAQPLEAGLKGLSGVYLGGIHGFRNFLAAVGMSDTTANRLTRDFVAASEVLGVTGLGGGGASSFVANRALHRAEDLAKIDAFDAEVAKLVTEGMSPSAARSAVLKSEVGHEYAEVARRFNIERSKIKAEKVRKARDRALNRARAEARRRAGPEATMQDIHEEAVNIAGRGLNDVEIEIIGDELRLRPPEEIIETAPITQEVLTTGIQRQAMEVAKGILRERGGPGPLDLSFPRVQQEIVSILASDRARTVRLITDVEAAGMDFPTFLNAFLHTGSEAGRALQIRSQFHRNLRAEAILGNPDAERVLQKLHDAAIDPKTGRPYSAGPTLTPIEAAFLNQGFWGKTAQLTRIFRKAIISLPVTATRNFIDSGGFRSVLYGANRAIDQSLARLYAPGSVLARNSGRLKPEVEAAEITGPGNSFDALANIYVQLIRTPLHDFSGGRIEQARVRKLLDRVTAAFPEIRSRAFASLEADVMLRGVAKKGGVLDKVEAGLDQYGLYLNRAQEFIIRRAVLASKLDEELRKVGSSLEGMVDAGEVPAGFNQALTTAIETALEQTFALPPTARGPLSSFFNGYARVIESVPPLAFLEPFPRFIFNATKLMVEQMPTAGLRLMTAQNRAKLAEGDFTPLARELTGSAMFATALAIRQGQFPGMSPGDRFDEVVTQDGNLASLAPFATIIPYLFLADLTIRMDEGRITPSQDMLVELRRGLLSSAPQVAQTTDAIEAAFDVLADNDNMAGLEKLAEFSGEVGSGFFRPFQLLKDFRTEWNDAVGLQRETRGQGMSGPILNLVYPEALPERESPTRAATGESARVTLPGGWSLSAGLFSQLSGVRVREPRNLIESEITRLGFTGRDLSPKTGDKRLDALVARYHGPILEQVGAVVLNTDMYRNLPVRTQQEVVRRLINITREPARDVAKAAAPLAFFERKLDRMPTIEQNAIFEQLDIILRSQGHKFRSADLIEGLAKRVQIELEGQGLGKDFSRGPLGPFLGTQ